MSYIIFFIFLFALVGYWVYAGSGKRDYRRFTKSFLYKAAADFFFEKLYWYMAIRARMLKINILRNL